MISTHTLNSTNNDKFKYYAEADDTILNNMQELEQGDMEQKIINRAKMLMFEQGKSINDAIFQAIHEIDEPAKTLAMFDITINDYIESIKRKMEV